MALVKCIDCGKEISTHAVYCPNCGRPVSGNALQTQWAGGKWERNGFLLILAGIFLGLARTIRELMRVPAPRYVPDKVGAYSGCTDSSQAACPE